MTREEAITIIDNLHLIGCGRNQHENDLKINIALDMAIEALQAEPNCSRCAIKELWQATEKEDLVAVVRCKDCRHYHKSEMYSYCSIINVKGRSPKKIDFCSCGERKGGEDE